MLVSICIPAYEAGRYIGRALASVRSQTYVHWELLVVEDGSSQAVESVVLEFSASVSQTVRYLKHDKNRGLPAARNTAFHAASGELLALLDADDYWDDTHLEHLVSGRTQTQADVVYAGSLVFDDLSGNIVGRRTPIASDISNFPVSLYTGTFCIQPSSVAIARARLIAIGGSDESFQHCEDLELWFRAAKNGFAFAFSGEETCFYRKHPGAMSKNSPAMAIAAAKVYSKHYDWGAVPMATRRHLTASMLLAAGRLNWRRDPGMAYGWVKKSLSVKPTVMGLLYLAITVIAAVIKRDRLRQA